MLSTKIRYGSKLHSLIPKRNVVPVYGKYEDQIKKLRDLRYNRQIATVYSLDFFDSSVGTRDIFMSPYRNTELLGYAEEDEVLGAPLNVNFDGTYVKNFSPSGTLVPGTNIYYDPSSKYHSSKDSRARFIGIAINTHDAIVVSGRSF